MASGSAWKVCSKAEKLELPNEVHANGWLFLTVTKQRIFSNYIWING